jgi:hypothetical protein
MGVPPYSMGERQTAGRGNAATLGHSTAFGLPFPPFRLEPPISLEYPKPKGGSLSAAPLSTPPVVLRGNGGNGKNNGEIAGVSAFPLGRNGRGNGWGNGRHGCSQAGPRERPPTLHSCLLKKGQEGGPNRRKTRPANCQLAGLRRQTPTAAIGSVRSAPIKTVKTTGNPAGKGYGTNNEQ